MVVGEEFGAGGTLWRRGRKVADTKERISSGPSEEYLTVETVISTD
jgi:hypothetical protein